MNISFILQPALGEIYQSLITMVQNEFDVRGARLIEETQSKHQVLINPCLLTVLLKMHVQCSICAVFFAFHNSATVTLNQNLSHDANAYPLVFVADAESAKS
jgi:hypothetical protein